MHPSPFCLAVCLPLIVACGSSGDDGATNATGGTGFAAGGATAVGGQQGLAGANTGGVVSVSSSAGGRLTSSVGGAVSATTGGTSSGGSGGAVSTTTGGRTSSLGGSAGSATGGTNQNGGTGGGSANTGGSVSDTLVSKGEFSFFVVSLSYIKSVAPCSGSTANNGKTCAGGLGGKLGGLVGADNHCTQAARAANPGDNHQWKAFLSTVSGPVHAIERIGTGPWYSAPPKYTGATSYATGGLLVASNITGLLNGSQTTSRPNGDTTTVFRGVSASSGAGVPSNWPLKDCLLNEFGNCAIADGDTHDTITGSGPDGRVYSKTDKRYTCDDWTNNTKGYGSVAFGHSWPRLLTDTESAGWINTGELDEVLGCGGIINVSTNNYFGDPFDDQTWYGGVGSGGGYGAFYCFAYVTGSE